MIFRNILTSLFLTLPFCQAGDLRVATWNVLDGLEAPGSTSYDAALAILGRINADVVALQEVRNADNSGVSGNLEQLASAMGYAHVFVPQNGSFDSNNYSVILSRYPFLSSSSIVSPSGSKDLTRAHAAVVVDVPNTDEDPLVISVHLKCCFEPDDFFRRAVELQRVVHFLDTEGYTGSDPIIVLGDFNLLGTAQSYTEEPAGLPITYSLGPDISFPVNYSPNPDDYFTTYPLTHLMAFQQNGTSQNTFMGGGSTLDYIVASQLLAQRNPDSEIYNTSLEASFPGLTKSGSALAAGVGADGSDHYPVFADFSLTGGIPISLALSQENVAEGNTVELTVTLPTPAADDTTVTITSSDTGEAEPEMASIIFQSGEQQKSVTIFAKNDSLLDGPQVISLGTTSGVLSGGPLNLTVTDIDLPIYSIKGIVLPLAENFDGFLGESTPAAWISTNTSWQGLDDGSLSTRGPRSYGEGSVGFRRVV